MVGIVPPGTGEFPAKMASNAENVSIWWRHHVKQNKTVCIFDVAEYITLRQISAMTS